MSSSDFSEFLQACRRYLLAISLNQIVMPWQNFTSFILLFGIMSPNFYQFWLLALKDVAKGGVGGVSRPPTFFPCRHFHKFHGIQQWKKKIKNLWRRKGVRREIFRNREVRVEGNFVPFNPYFVCNTAIGLLCEDFYRKSYDFSIKNC